MGTLEEALKAINYKQFCDIVNSMDSNSPSFGMELKDLVEHFIGRILGVCKNSSVEVIIGILDYFYLNYPNFVVPLLYSKEEKILRAQLVIEKIKGHEISTLKNNIKTLKDIEIYGMVMNGVGSANMKKKDISEKVLDAVHSFLENKDIEVWSKKVNSDLIKFIKNIKKVEKDMFNGQSNPYYNKYEFMKRIFLMDVMLKNNAFLGFDYYEIVDAKMYLIAEVKGLFIKFPFDLFDPEDLDKDDYEEFSSFLREMVDLNKDDEDGLRWFFLNLSESAAYNIDFLSYLTEQNYFQYYTSKTFNDMYEEAMIKMKMF